MEFEPLVSIITPAFNAERYIVETINSVINQTYKNWELIIVDDKSSDQTVAIIKKIAKKDNRIKLIEHLHNSGPAIARNTALSFSKGDYIAFLDSDDLWLKNKLENQIKIMLENKYCFTYTSYKRISFDGSVIGHQIVIPDSLSYHKLLKNTAIATSTVIINKNIIGDFTMKNTYYDDFACWLEILKKGCSAIGINQDLVRYRVVNNSVSRDKLHSAKMVWRAYREIERLGILYSVWCFLNYSINAFMKYRKF